MSKTGKKITLAEGLKEAVGVVKDKKKLNEGAGAGYKITSNCTIKKVNSLSLEKIDSFKENVTYGIVYVDATFNCDIDLYVTDLEFASYDFGGNVDRGVDGKATKISLSMTFEADSMRIDSDFVERKINGAIEDIKSLLVGETFDTKIVYGGGWSHVTYDGTIAELSDVYSVDYTGTYHNDYDTEVTGADAKITEQDVIDFIDKDVQGDNVEEIYSVLDETNALLDSFGTFEEAKDYAFSEKDAKRIVKETAVATFDGDVDYLNDYEIVWEADDEVEESLKLKEDNILVSPEFIKKRDALADYFGEEGEVRYDKDMDLFILFDGRAYFVYTGDEADQKAKEEVINAIDDMGIEAFTPDFQQDIIDNQMVDVDWFDDAMKESYEFYADDIMSEDGEHGNRLFDEMIEEGVISEEDVTEDGELVDGIDLDEKKEEFVEKLCENWDNGVQWYIDNFGEKDFSDVCKKHDLYDYDEIAETAIRWDGRGHFISMYDGEELDIGDDLFAYKYEEGWDWDKADSIHESMNESFGTKVAKWYDDKYEFFKNRERDTYAKYYTTIDKEHSWRKDFDDYMSTFDELMDKYDPQGDKDIDSVVDSMSREDKEKLAAKYKLYLNEDTVKTKDGKWANVGDDGKVDSGKFKTKKEADAQRRAMYAQGYRG